MLSLSHRCVCGFKYLRITKGFTALQSSTSPQQPSVTSEARDLSQNHQAGGQQLSPTAGEHHEAVHHVIIVFITTSNVL